MKNLPEHIVLFDGVCNLCNRSIQYIIRNDSKSKFIFVPFQSEAGKNLSAIQKVKTTNMESVVYLHKGNWFVKSDAALKIAFQLKGANKLFVLCWIIPKFIRDSVYMLISRNRYRWFGKRDSCMIPSEELRDRFVLDFIKFS